MVTCWAQETPFNKKNWTDLKHSSTRKHIIVVFFTLSCVTYFEHAETGRLHVSGSVYITLHEIHAIFRQSCQQDALQITSLLHLIGQLVYVTRQLNGGEMTVYYIVHNETWINSGVSGSYLSVV